MIARYAGGASGARAAARAGATAVIVDAFRASTTVAVLVAKGARVKTVASLEEAQFAEADFRIGERGSVKVAGFDFGNSPTRVGTADIPWGSTVVLSTTNGTRVIEAARGAACIFTGAFVNASILAEELTSGPYGPEIVVVGCGWKGRRASEDEAAAGAILYHLKERRADLDPRARRLVEGYLHRDRKTLRSNSAARRLKRVGHEKDLDFCLAEDTVPVVPRLAEGAFVNGRT